MLPFEITLVEGVGADARWNSQTLRSQQSNPSVPVSLVAKMRRRVGRVTRPVPDDASIVAQFLKRQHVDVLLAEYGTTAASITPACRLAEIPLVAHFHGFDASRRSVIAEYRSSYLKMFAYAASVVVVSNDMRGRLIGLGCSPAKLVVSPCGPGSAFLSVEPAVDSNLVVAVGRLVEKKGPDLLIRAFHKVLATHPDLRLMIVGDGPMRSKCEDLVNSLRLQGSIQLVGSATSDEIRGYLGQSFLFAQHSVVASDGDSEGTPVAIMEASAAGLPVVATRHAGIPDVILNGETGLLVEEHDVEGMAAAIVALAEVLRTASAT
jgi:glycosyltransferase involved in cell wall biosynthesis